MGRKKDQDLVPFDPQNNPVISMAFSAMERDSSIPGDVMDRLRSVLSAEITGEGITIQTTAAKKVNHTVLDRSLKQYEVVAVKGIDRYYKRAMDPQTGTPLEDVFHPTDKEELVNIITDNYEKVTGTVDGPAIDKIWNSADKKIRKDNLIEKVDNTIIQIVPDMFWDTDEGRTYDKVPDGRKCYRKLFDTDKEGRHIVKYAPHTFDVYMDDIKSYISTTYVELIEHDGDLEEDEDFEFIQTVACHDHGRYMDLLRMMATFFMKKKPLGSYILEGNGRNGKSSFIGLIHTIMGTRNTSRLQLAELGNWHKNHCLVNTLVNAPDEEKPGTLEDTDLFRTIADHGTIELDVMHGQKPIEVTCDFQCVSASNHLPNWEGVDAEACIRRARIIPFRADLSGEDNKSISFEEETYTPERIAHLVGVVLGIAKYYMHRDFPESHSSEVMRDILKENMVSYRIFYTSFVSFFGKYHKLRDVYDDYVIWCKDRGYKINRYDEFKEAFNDSREKKTSYTNADVSISVVYKVSNLNTCFHSGWICPEAKMYGSVLQMHEEGVSALTVLENLRNKEVADFNDQGRML